MPQLTTSGDAADKIAALRRKSHLVAEVYTAPRPSRADRAPRANRPGKLRIVVAIPSAQRPGILSDTVRAIARQDRLPDRVVLSLGASEDLGDLNPSTLPFPLEIVRGRGGATARRNQIIRILRRDEIMVLLSDDFLMAPDYLRRTLDVFERYPDIAMTTGTVLADGMHGPGFSHEKGQALLARRLQSPAADRLQPVFSGHGCNSAMRASVILDRGLRFDESFPLYGGLEDLDFSRRIAAHGRLVKDNAARGVHLGTKTGRPPGMLLGYSQVIAPLHLLKKGTMTRRQAVAMIARDALSNLFRAIHPPAWADFRGRLRGNLRAVRDLLQGRASPQRMLDLKP
ncbi:glycosyltransferase family 2 protein [Rhodovulum adriaticum]|uniref:GT2 family glycosyltransferase n=1 Tax=Rhodovulum adriaticum TaxID=35804 RepID=A0A4R2NKV8_RHOAD|nr:glycosyltransferase [Rhodovulum adriaticum]MBK1635126.1 hypothetical protein [Rhodovulum adriaticum]TCP22239.1 GT2 family glycosyltransferase [Rhodovulum adriaticum]